MRKHNGIGTAIRTTRKKKRITQRKLSELSGLSINAILCIEKGKAYPHGSTIKRIAESLGVSINWLYFMSISPDDVHPNKRDVFNTIFAAMVDVLYWDKPSLNTESE